MVNLIQISSNIEYTRRDFSEGIRILNHSQKYHVLFRVFAIIVFLVASVYLYLSISATTSTQIPDYLIALLYGLALFLLLDIPRHLEAWRVFNNYQKQGFNTIVLTVNSDGVFSKTSSSESHSGWDQFVRTYENDKLFLLVLESKNFLIFPKRHFPVKVDIASFRELTKEKVSDYMLVK